MRSILIFFGLIWMISCCSKDSKPIKIDKEIVLRLEPSVGNPRNSEGDFVQLKNGNILFIYTHFTEGTGDNASAYLASRFSSDMGETWSEKDALALANEGKMNIMSVSLLRLKNGDIALFYLRKNSESSCIPFMRKSTDEAQTWSKPQACIDTDGYFVVNNDRFVQLTDNRIIFPTALHDSGAMGKIMCYYSDDNGKNWKKSRQVANPDSIVLQEPGIIELKNGKLMLFCRTNSGFQYFSFSDNQGETWSPIKKGNIKSPLSPASIKRIPSTGDLLLVWNNNFEQARDGGKRTPFNLAISKNEGKIWEKIKTIESDPEGCYCYTAIEFVDGHLLLGHCAGNTRVQSGLATTQITRLNLDWVYTDATSIPYIKKSDSTGFISLACKDKNAQIYYSLDGTMPDRKNGKLYNKPFKLAHITPLYMQAFHENKTPSNLVRLLIGTNIWQPAQMINHALEPGLNYQYFEAEIHNTQTIDSLDIVSSGIVPFLSIGEAQKEHNFAFIFDAYLKIPKDDIYTFYLNSNDGSVLFIDNFKLIDNDGAHGAYEKNAKVSLKKGLHKIKLKYFQAGGGSLLKLSWATRDITKQEIPKDFLFHELKNK